jgi:hypothetical protein
VPGAPGQIPRSSARTARARARKTGTGNRTRRFRSRRRAPGELLATRIGRSSNCARKVSAEPESMNR